jgi:predicted metalloprotease
VTAIDRAVDWSAGARSSTSKQIGGRKVSRGVKAGGLGGLGLLIVVVVAMLLGVDPQQLLQDVEVAQVPSSASVSSPH